METCLQILTRFIEIASLLPPPTLGDPEGAGAGAGGEPPVNIDKITDIAWIRPPPTLGDPEGAGAGAGGEPPANIDKITDIAWLLPPPTLGDPAGAGSGVGGEPPANTDKITEPRKNVLQVLETRLQIRGKLHGRNHFLQLFRPALNPLFLPTRSYGPVLTKDFPKLILYE